MFYREKEDTAESDFPFQERLQEKLLATCNSSADGVLAGRALSCPVLQERRFLKRKKTGKSLTGEDTQKERNVSKFRAPWPLVFHCGSPAEAQGEAAGPLGITTGTPGAFCQLHFFPRAPLSSPPLSQ